MINCESIAHKKPELRFDEWQLWHHKLNGSPRLVCRRPGSSGEINCVMLFDGERFTYSGEQSLMDTYAYSGTTKRMADVTVNF